MPDNFYGTGRRKSSVARVTITEGSGKFTFNGKDLEQYFPSPSMKMTIEKPFKVVSLEGKFDMVVNVCLLYTSPSPRDLSTSRMPSSA